MSIAQIAPEQDVDPGIIFTTGSSSGPPSGFRLADVGQN